MLFALILLHTPIVYSDSPTESVVSAKLVGAPVPMCAEEISGINNDSDLSNYVIDLDFDVTKNGRAKNITVVNSNTPIALHRLIKRLVHHYRFRPGLVNGSPATEKMHLQQTFDSSESDSNQFSVGKIATIHGCNLLTTI